MRITKEEDPEEVAKYAHIKPTLTFGPLRCFAKCPGSRKTRTLDKAHSGPHVAHALLARVAAVWDDEALGGLQPDQGGERTEEGRMNSPARAEDKLVQFLFDLQKVTCPPGLFPVLKLGYGT